MLRAKRTLKDRFLIWLLRNRRSDYARLKKLRGLAVSEDQDFLNLHQELLEDGRGIQTFTERYNLYSLAKATCRLPGALAEAGVYRGGSAKILCHVKGESPIYLFDTFEGMPEVDAKRDGVFSKGDFADTQYNEVVSYLSGYKNVHAYKGFFPESAVDKEPEQQTYRFVHLDMDIYDSTIQALRFFYPRMVRGALLVSHDYNRLDAPGVKRAFNEFFSDKPETVIPLWDTQCVFTKM
jgi:hypothetical protein